MRTAEQCLRAIKAWRRQPWGTSTPSARSTTDGTKPPGPVDEIALRQGGAAPHERGGGLRPSFGGRKPRGANRPAAFPACFHDCEPRGNGHSRRAPPGRSRPGATRSLADWAAGIADTTRMAGYNRVIAPATARKFRQWRIWSAGSRASRLSWRPDCRGPLERCASNRTHSSPASLLGERPCRKRRAERRVKPAPRAPDFRNQSGASRSRE
jgi:hypothetical protein